MRRVHLGKERMEFLRKELWKARMELEVFDNTRYIKKACEPLDRIEAKLTEWEKGDNN